jgi:hypothetical protein
MQKTKRRSRMHRTSSGKRVELTERDIELFELLNRYHFLRSNFMYAFLGGNSETRFKERLGHLYHDGRYINRPEQQWQFANCRYMPVVHELDDRGEQVLRGRGLIQSDSPLLKKGRMGAYRQFAHELMICDCMASIELGVRQNQNLRFISWQEIIAKAPESTRKLDNPFAIPVSISHTFSRIASVQRADIKVVPDGLFGLEYASDGQKMYRFFALEADRNTLPVIRSDLHQTSYLRKILAYRQISVQSIHKSHFGLPNLLVLTVTTNQPHMANIMSLVGELAHEGKAKLFLFKTMSSVGDFKKAPEPTTHMLTDAWQRVGYEALRIDRP